MTDCPPKKDSGFGKVGSSILAAALSGYIVNKFSLHGVDFTEFGVPSEVVKASIEGTLVGFFVWLTPQNFIDEVVCFIVFLRASWRKIRNAANGDDDVSPPK